MHSLHFHAREDRQDSSLVSRTDPKCLPETVESSEKFQHYFSEHLDERFTDMVLLWSHINVGEVTISESSPSSDLL